MNVNVNSTSVTSWQTSAATPPTSSIATIHARLKLAGRYRSIFRTVREGDFHATLTGIHLSLAYRRAGGGDDAPMVFECHPRVDEVQVELTPLLLDEVDEALGEHVSDSVCTHLCQRARRAVEEWS